MFRKWKSSIIKPIQGALLKITSRHDYTLILYLCYTYTRHIHMSILTSVTRSYYFALAVYFLPNVMLETSFLNLEVDPFWNIRRRITEHLHQHQHLLSRKKKKNLSQTSSSWWCYERRCKDMGTGKSNTLSCVAIIFSYPGCTKICKLFSVFITTSS